MSAKVKGRAKFDFTGKEELKQLSFKKGDLVVISQQYDNGWWAGELNGKIGYVPATYIEIVPDSQPSGPPSRPQPNPPPGGASRPPSNPNPPNPVSRPPQGGGAPNGNIARPGGGNAPPAVAGRPPVKNPPPVVGRPPVGAGGGGGSHSRPQAMIAEEEDGDEEVFIPAAKSVSVSTVTTSNVGMSAKSAPPVAQRGGAHPVAQKSGGGGSGGSSGKSTGVSEADFDELEQLIRKLHNDVTDLKQLM